MRPLPLVLILIILCASSTFSTAGTYESSLHPQFTLHPDLAMASFGSTMNPSLLTGDNVDASHTFYEDSKHPGLALTEVAILEFIPWALAKWIRHWEDPADNWANVSSKTWWNNLQKGWEYDGDNFLTNLFSHPYHGALFFNAGRTNGYSFWESVPYSLGGSFVWEQFGETFRPSFNDWIMTGVNGAFFGEGLYRLSILVTDNTATGSERVWREIGGALVNPVRGFTRLLSGETGKVQPNPAEHDPSTFQPVFTAGVRSLDADGTDFNKDVVTQAVAALDLRYGNMFADDYRTPFSSFNFTIVVAVPNRAEDSTKLINRISFDGVLHGWKLSKDEKVTHLLMIRGIYDYLANPAFEFGQTAVSPELNSLYTLSEDWKMQVGIGVRGILMGGTPNDYYVDAEGRNYDLGPGFGSKGIVSFVTKGWDVFTVFYTGGWIWTQSEPSKSKHHFHVAAIMGRYPFSEAAALGLELAVYWRDSYYLREYYDDVTPVPPQPYLPNVHKRNPIARLVFSYVAW